MVQMGREPDDTDTARPSDERRKTPTWVGQIVKAKDEQFAALKELSEDKEQWIREQLERELAERTERSKALYQIAKERADEQATTIKRLWITIVIQSLIIAALAGVTVTGKIPFIGDIGLDQQKQADGE